MTPYHGPNPPELPPLPPAAAPDSVKPDNGFDASLLGGGATDDELFGAIEQIGRAVEQLSDTERDRLDQIARLMDLEPSGSHLAKSISRDAKLALQVADDAMSATLSIRPAIGCGRAIEPRHVEAMLAKRGVTHGVDHEAIAAAIRRATDGVAVTDAVIARGSQPERSNRDRVQLFVRPRKGADPIAIDPIAPVSRERADRRYDLCEVGDVVLRLIPGKQGAPGSTVTGRPLPPEPAEPLVIAAGENLKVKGRDFIAEAAGVVRFDGREIVIHKVLVVEGDVQPKDGPIDFEGEVVVRGGVRNGASIRATGDITIDGFVEAASVESTGGDVCMRHGVAGQNSAVIRARGDVTSHFAENATIIAGHDVVIDVGTLHSRLVAGNQVQMMRGRGQIVGGTVQAGKLIQVKQVGSPGDVRTSLLVGMDWPVMEQISQLDQLLAQHRARYEEATQQADRLARLGDPMQLPEIQRASYARLLQLQLVSEVKIRKINEARDELLAGAARKAEGRIEVLGSLMPGVALQIGDASTVIKQLRKGVSVKYDPDKAELTFERTR